MLRKWRTFQSAIAVVLLGSLLMVPVPAQDPVSSSEGATVDPLAGSFEWKGGPARGKVARTQTSATKIPEAAGWRTLPGATLKFSVPTTDNDGALFNVAFSAECRLFNGGADDYLRIRIVDMVGGGVVPLEPYDGEQAFCSADAYATHKGNWVRRVRPGDHSLAVQLWVFDGAPAEAVTAVIDDWTFELVVYD